MNCIEATRLISERLERPLGRGEQFQLKIHTLMCSGCRNFDHQAPMLRVISRQYSPLNTEPTAPSDKASKNDEE